MPSSAALLLGLGAAGSIGGGIAGAAASSDDRARALAQNQNAIQQWLAVNVPDPAQQKVILQKYVQTGELDPQLEQQVKQDSTQLATIQTDPSEKASQLRALSSLENLGLQGGLNLTDEANLQKANLDTQAQERGQRGAIMNNFAARGMGGTGMELQAQLQNAQNSTNRMGQASLDTAGAARDRALQAVMGSGQLAGNLRSQDYGEKANAAAAQDAINQFNTRNLQGVQGRNVNRQNAANTYNLNQKQNISNANTGLANQQEMYNQGLYQQQFNNQATKAAGSSGQYNNLANAYGQEANRTAGQYAGVGQGLGQLGTGLAENSMYEDYMDRRYPKKGAGNYAGSDDFYSNLA